MLIEPVAVQLDYWHWANDIIPLKNYYCWFFISAFILLIFERFRFKKQSLVAPVFLGMQFVFFAVAYWT
jgi:putative membrane protein